ncbi:BREX system Lon protease-like protein BrxL [Fusobacterium sp. HC1336]|uniref:BREX system Lon protease-like protein BrxL n=1 Tax=Fusobacterium sp. HC1336 TaxID=3171169 RepID=UPI003F242A4A
MENNVDFTIDKNIKDTEKIKSILLVKKRDIQEKIKGELSNRFTPSEIISLLYLEKYNKVKEEEFYLREYLEINKKLKDNPKICLTVSISNINFLDRTIKIKGADAYLNFVVSKFDMETLKYFLDNNYENVLAEVTIRKHKGEILFVEKIIPLVMNDEEIYRLILELREQLTTVEWKNLLLHSLGYDLSDSKSILKDLMLVRAIPYVEKNYSYIELGPYSTGKTSFSELFTTAEKISTDISMAQLYYNVKEKKDGLLFYKDVLYLDEADFSDLGAEEARVLLQVLSGNKINVRDNSISKNTDVSIVSQGNVIKGLEEYIEGDIFNRFKKAFNPGAFFDRTNFFIAGWLIPIYERIKSNSEEEIIPTSILERVFTYLRKVNVYDEFINKNFDIILISDNPTQGRFIKSIKSTISGFLKLLYFGKNINIETEMEEIEKIILLSILGKYSIYHNTLETSESKVEVYYNGKRKMVVDIKNLINDYIQSKENIYFEPKLEKNLINESDNEDFIEYKLQWENDRSNSLIAKKILRKYKKEKISSFPKPYEDLLKLLEDYEIKEKYEEFYRIVVTYDINDYLDEYYSKEIQKERNEFLHAYTAISILFFIVSQFKISEILKNFIIKFMKITLEKKELSEWEYITEEKKIRELIRERDFVTVSNEQSVSFKSTSNSIRMKLLELKENITINFNNNKNEFNHKNIVEKIRKFNILTSNRVAVYKNEKGITSLVMDRREEEKNKKTLHEELMSI